MPTFEFTSPEGQKYSVNGPDGSTPEQAFDVLRQHLGAAAPAPITVRDVVRAGLHGVPVLGGLANKAIAGLNAVAGPLASETVASRAPTLSQRYAENLERENTGSEKFAAEHPIANTAAELAGGTAALAPLGATTLGARLLGLTGGNRWRQAGAGLVSGAALNATDAGVRGNDPLTAAIVGGGIGSAAPSVARAAGVALSPIISNIAAKVNPRGFAEGQVARGITESGRTADQIASDVTQAAREGQSQFTVADAMGNAGQRLLAPIARAPGEGRTEAVNFLEQRQAGQGRRVANALAEGFQAPETAAQTAARLTTERATEGAQNYGAARQAAGSVNVTPAIAEIDRTLQPGVSGLARPQSGIADDSIEGMLRRARGMLTDGRSQVSRFDEAFRVKQEFDNLIDRAPPTAQRVLIPVRNALDNQLATSSPFYRAARDRYREQSQAIEAIGLGRNAALRGRTENTIPQFQGLSQPEQAGFRSGYVDPHIETAQGAAMGVNKARPLTSDAFRDESQVMAPGADLMNRRIGRENTMFETRNAATGGSKTYDNFADAEAMGKAVDIARNVATGNVHGLVGNALGFMGRILTGNNPAVRQEAARLLLMRGGNVSAQDLRDVLNSAVQQVRARQRFTQLATTLAARSAAQQISAAGTR